MTNDAAGAELKQDGADKVRITREIGKQAVPTFRTARRASSSPRRGRCSTASGTLESTATRDVQVRLERPRVSVVSTHHYVNLGGSEMVVYRATPADVASGRARRRHRVSRATRRPAPARSKA